jgi:hypothetical protein
MSQKNTVKILESRTHKTTQDGVAPDRVTFLSNFMRFVF